MKGMSDENYGKKRYHRLKALGLCTQCGTPVLTGERLCNECRAKYNKVREEERMRNQSLWKEEKPKPKKKTGYTLDELVIMARKEGISYGQLVTRLEGRT